ncbi:MAG: hypothetical protein Q4D65_10870 [Peptostreptococcaceae bacterium]|nr:hypothetical protein [Peptostreptococcaceae bacterium]
MSHKKDSDSIIQEDVGLYEKVTSFIQKTVTEEFREGSIEMEERIKLEAWLDENEKDLACLRRMYKQYNDSIETLRKMNSKTKAGSMERTALWNGCLALEKEVQQLGKAIEYVESEIAEVKQRLNSMCGVVGCGMTPVAV